MQTRKLALMFAREIKVKAVVRPNKMRSQLAADTNITFAPAMSSGVPQRMREVVPTTVLHASW